MNVHDIPREMLEKLRIQYESNPEVRRLRTRQEYLQMSGKYLEALEVAKALDNLYAVVLQGYISKAEGEAEVFDTETADISNEDREAMMVHLMTVFMACDVIESAVLDFNDVMHKVRPDRNVTAFNDIRQLSDMAKQKLKYLQETGDYMKDLMWADKCDDMYSMMLNKARSIVRKRRDSRSWGRNTERLVNR